jgi:demethylmenaquinone methyltransferase/2-methoxy-6-polyprenyl-1,4-benzoquinol methylase
MIPFDLASRYDAAASNWHRNARWLDYPQAYAQFFARLHAAAWLGPLGPGARVLECGIGTGVLSLALARVVPFREVVGVDIAPAMLREARRNLAAAGMAADLHRGDAHRLAQPDASFDAVISAHMLEHLARPQEAIGEMARVLRPGAPLIIVATRGNLADQLLRLKWRHVPIGREQLIAWMCRAGVENIGVYRIGNVFSSLRVLSRAFVGRRSL